MPVNCTKGNVYFEFLYLHVQLVSNFSLLSLFDFFMKILTVRSFSVWTYFKLSETLKNFQKAQN